MQEYVIKEIYTDGYERFAIVEGIEQDVKLNVYFCQYDEYLENSEASRKKKKGDILKGDVSIDKITVCEKVNKELFYLQEIEKSPYIEAIVEVAQIIDEYSLYAISSIVNYNVLIEFESAVDYRVGDRVFVIGELKLNEVVKE